MPLPRTPQEFRELIPSPGGNFCEKFLRLVFKLPQYIYDIYAYLVDESGKLTPEAAALICQFNCKGGTGTGTGDITPPVISASDGGFLDRVRITWTGVAAATGYDIYRNFTDDVNGAVMIGSTGSATIYDDTNVNAGTIYWYWVKAKNAFTTSLFSNSDSGYTAVELPAVSDLQATQGFAFSSSAVKFVNLVWTPPAGAGRYDIYRSETDNFSTATKIDADRIPYDNSNSFSTGPSPTFVDNGGELIYQDAPPNQFLTYYYWVIAKAATGASISTASNSAAGWAIGDGSGVLPLSGLTLSSGDPAVAVPAGAVRAWVVLFGSGAGGAGGGSLYGGGGGGASAVVYGKHNITGATPKYKIVSTPEADTVRATAAQNGAASALTRFQFAGDGTTFSTLMTANATATGGLYSATGGGAGGPGASGSKDAAVTAGGIKDGRSGQSAMGSKGGRSGYIFGGTRYPAAHFIISWAGDGSNTQPAASGSNAHPALGSLVEGGVGRVGRGIVIFYAS